MPKVFFPPTMRTVTGGVESIDAVGKNVRELLEDLDRQLPGTMDALCVDGSLKPDVAVAISGEIATLGMLQKVPEDAEIHFLPVVAGG